LTFSLTLHDKGDALDVWAQSKNRLIPLLLEEQTRGCRGVDEFEFEVDFVEMESALDVGGRTKLTYPSGLFALFSKTERFAFTSE
jgi:hypothetical protein